MCNTPILPVPVVVHWDGRFLCVQFEHRYFVHDMQYIDLPLPKPKMWCIIENTNTCSISGGDQMTDREKYMLKLIRTSADPSAAMEKVRKILSSDPSPTHEAQRPAGQEKRF